MWQSRGSAPYPNALLRGSAHADSGASSDEDPGLLIKTKHKRALSDWVAELAEQCIQQRPCQKGLSYVFGSALVLQTSVLYQTMRRPLRRQAQDLGLGTVGSTF